MATIIFKLLSIFILKKIKLFDGTKVGLFCGLTPKKL
jgi:hypothetical protein